MSKATQNSTAPVRKPCGRPRKPDAHRKTKNRASVYISDDSLSRLGIVAKDVPAYFDNHVEGRIREIEANDGR